MNKEQKKFIQRRLGWYSIRVFTFFNGIIPLSWNYFLGYVLGSIAYLLIRRHRNVALDSLSIAFPQYSLNKRKKIARNFFIYMAQGSFELLHVLKKPEVLEHSRIQGKEHLDKALEKGKGAIILTAHLGNFPLMSLKLAKSGFTVNILTRPLRDEKAGDYLYNLRTRAGVKTIFSYPRRECIAAIIRSLRDNEIVIIQMDQNFGTGGVWVKFFGKLAATPVGPIVLALRTGASIVPGYIYREGLGKHCIKILPEQELTLTDSKEETALLNVIKFTRIIEGWIKEVGPEWGWVHKRWKSQPSDKIKKAKYKVEQ